MQAADATGTTLRSSETTLRALPAQTGLDRMWAELAMRSLGLHADTCGPVRDAQPSWGRIAALLLESTHPF